MDNNVVVCNFNNGKNVVYLYFIYKACSEQKRRYFTNLTQLHDELLMAIVRPTHDINYIPTYSIILIIH